MNREAEKFLEYLEDAECLLVDFLDTDEPATDFTLDYSPSKHLDLAGFSKWMEFCEPKGLQDQTIRLIQHLSCTGGSIICKSLASMPNVLLLSEVNPLSELLFNSQDKKFAPTDLAYLARLARVPQWNELSEKLFKAEIREIVNHAQLYGKYVFVREHSHSDFLVGETPKRASTVRRLLREDYPVLPILTVRHPVDSYLSMLRNGWVGFAPGTFDEYCRRYLLFLEHNHDVPRHKYEDFVRDPKAELKKMSENLKLPYQGDFEDTLDLVTLTGDSGRSASVISKRDRHSFDQKFRIEVSESANYSKICESLEYQESLET